MKLSKKNMMVMAAIVVVIILIVTVVVPMMNKSSDSAAPAAPSDSDDSNDSGCPTEVLQINPDRTTDFAPLVGCTLSADQQKCWDSAKTNDRQHPAGGSCLDTYNYWFYKYNGATKGNHDLSVAATMTDPVSKGCRWANCP